NLKFLWKSLLCYSWWLPLILVGAVRFGSFWGQYPRALRRLLLLAVPMFGLALFKGWIEEMRQYMELLPIFGLLMAQWTLEELGLGRLLRTRQECESEELTTEQPINWKGTEDDTKSHDYRTQVA